MNPFLPEFCFYLSLLLPLPPSTSKVSHHFLLPQVVLYYFSCFAGYVESHSCASFTHDSLLWRQMIVSSILCKRPLPSIASILLRTCSVGVANFNVLTALPAHLRGFSRLLIMIGNGSCIKQGQNMYLNLCLVCLFFLFVCLYDQPPTYEIKKLNLAQLDNNKEHNIT